MFNKFELLRIIENENSFESRDKFLNNILKFIRILVHFLLFMIVLTTVVVSKITVLFMTNEIAYYDHVIEITKMPFLILILVMFITFYRKMKTKKKKSG